MQQVISLADQQIRALVDLPVVCPGCVVEQGLCPPAAASTAHCPRHLVALATSRRGHLLTFAGSARLLVAGAIRAGWIAQVGQAAYRRQVQGFLRQHGRRTVAVACTQVAQLTTAAEEWLTVLAVLTELDALPDPLTITLAAGVDRLPFLTGGVA